MNPIQKAIKKALEGGWEPPFEEPIVRYFTSQAPVNGVIQLQPYIVFEVKGNLDYCYGIERILYDHDFARALWGDKQTLLGYLRLTEDDDEDNYYVPAWQHHLQEMVISNNFMVYLAEHL